MVTAFTRFKPTGFLSLGLLKDHVYQNNPQTIAELKEAINQQICGIAREECVRVINNFARRLQVCPQHRGTHLEHVLQNFVFLTRSTEWPIILIVIISAFRKSKVSLSFLPGSLFMTTWMGHVYTETLFAFYIYIFIYLVTYSKVACVVDIKLFFMDQFCYNLTVLIK